MRKGPQPWTEQQITEWVFDGWTDNEICDEIGRHAITFRSNIRPIRERLEQQRIDGILKLEAFASDCLELSQAEIAEKYQLTGTRVALELKRRGLTGKATVNREPVSPQRRVQVFSRDGYRCRFCGAKPSETVTLHVDHAIPRSKGGSNAMSNLQTLCCHCNAGKGTRVLNRPPAAA